MDNGEPELTGMASGVGKLVTYFPIESVLASVSQSIFTHLRESFWQRFAEKQREMSSSELRR